MIGDFEDKMHNALIPYRVAVQKRFRKYLDGASERHFAKMPIYNKLCLHPDLKLKPWVRARIEHALDVLEQEDAQEFLCNCVGFITEIDPRFTALKAEIEKEAGRRPKKVTLR